MQSVHCQMRVKNAVSPIPEVIIGNIHAGMAEFKLEEGAEEKAITAAITDAGYIISNIATEDEKNILHFKTNINCQSCVEKVSPFLDTIPGADMWEVDTDNPEKILTVDSIEVSAEDIMKKVRDAGFQIQPIN